MAASFGVKLRQLRRQRGWSQATLAQQLGVASQAYISNLEAGRKAPSLSLVVRAASTFSVTTDYLLRDIYAVEQIQSVALQAHVSERFHAEAFGVKLRELRRGRELTQTDLARHLNLQTHAHISHLESGRFEPAIEYVIQIAALFNVTTDFLLRSDNSVTTD